MPALLIVRAEVDPAERDAFDHWYETEHLPDAHAAFGSNAARRGWRDGEPLTHLAIYEFDEVEQARAIVGSEGMTAMRAEFDRNFPDVPRSREIIDLGQALP